MTQAPQALVEDVEGHVLNLFDSPDRPEDHPGHHRERERRGRASISRTEELASANTTSRLKNELEMEQFEKKEMQKCVEQLEEQLRKPEDKRFSFSAFVFLW